MMHRLPNTIPFVRTNTSHVTSPLSTHTRKQESATSFLRVPTVPASHFTWHAVLSIPILTLHIHDSPHDPSVHSLTVTHLHGSIRHDLPLFSTPIRPWTMIPLR
jgi:hypothetical protein